MATQVQFRRGTATQNNNFTGANGELSVNLSNYSLRLHDGVTAGGYEIARANMSNAIFGATVLPSANTTYNLGSASFKFANIFSQSFTGALVGNADTTTKLFTARNINGVAFDGTQDITIEAAIDKTLTIGTGLSGGTFDGATDVTVALKNSANFTDTNLLKWDSANGQFVNSLVTDNGTTASVGGNLTVTGDLLVQGATTTISTTNLVVSDKVIVIGDGTETTQAADGAGFNIGTTGVSLTYDLANTSWTSSESFNLATGKTYKIAGTTVIGSTSLGANIVTSSLTSVGTLTSLDVSGTAAFQTNVTIGTTLEVSGAATFDSTTTVDGATLSVEDTINGQTYALRTYIDANGVATIQKIGATYTTLKANNFYVQSQTGETIAGFFTNGPVELFYDNVEKLQTLSDGVEVYGDVYHRGQVVKDNSGNTTYTEYAINIENMYPGSPYTVDTWSYTNYNAAEYTITFDNYGAQSGSGFSAMQVTKILVMSDGLGNLWTTEQGSLYTDEANPCFTAAASINGSDARLQITPNSSYTNQNNDVKIKVTLFYR